MSQSTNTKNDQPITFLDAIGRTVIGIVSEETEDSLTIQNPALVAVQANPQTSQLQLQILPLFFREFLSNQSDPTFWVYKKNSITLSKEMNFNPQFLVQYQQLFTPPQSVQQAEPKVVKLFDEEESK